MDSAMAARNQWRPQERTRRETRVMYAITPNHRAQVYNRYRNDVYEDEPNFEGPLGNALGRTEGKNPGRD